MQHLKPDGALVCKVFHGSGHSQLVELFKRVFRVVKPIKPKASRDKSSETFLVGMGLKCTPRPFGAMRSTRDNRVPLTLHFPYGAHSPDADS